MQNLNQENSGSTPETTTSTEQPLVDTGTEAQVASSEPDAGEEEEEEDTTTAAAVVTETVIPPQENETGLQMAETPETEACTQAAEKETAVQPPSEPLKNSEEMEVDSASKQSASADCATDKDPQCGEQTAKKPEKGPHVGRRYVLSKKAMTDPLKMDMFDPPPLSSPHLSLQCFECHIIFSDYKSKKRHMKLSHPRQYEQHLLRDALFACYVCDRHFTNSSELMAHQKSHTEKKPFKCPLCDQAFMKSSELTRHKKKHFGQDGYACTECGKPCKTLTLLKYHRRTHTGERPYVCKECGKRFTMAKALTKHALTHLPEGAEEEGNPKAKVLQNKTDVRYTCSICKATFKTTKTRQYHMKTKHKSSNTLTADQQVKQSAPIITPISISQPALLQLEASGPLQKVDDNIDTEQICRLIESLGNVQKVNQVVILGQVPPHAPPLEVQSTAESVTLNASPVQIDYMALKQSQSKRIELDTLNNQCNNSLEQTIILEPITPDGQLDHPSFSELGSQIAASENIELTLVPTEQTEQDQGQVMHQILQQSEINAIQSDDVDQMVCQNEVADLKENLEETVILELTPALIPTSELEQSQTVPQNEISSSSLVPTTELEKTPDQTAHSTVIVEPDTNLEVPPFMPTVELELTPLQTEQQDLTLCPFVAPETLSQTPCDSERIPKEGVDTQIETVSLCQVHHVMKEAAPQETQESIEQEQSKQESPEKLLEDNKEDKEQLENKSEVEDTSAKEEVPSQSAIEQVPKVLNVMSAQELVKVRKRKPARAFIFQGYVQETAGSMPKDVLQNEARPAKRQRKKSHLVVKFGPQSKDKKNKKQRTPPQEHRPIQEEEIPTDLSDKKVVSQKKGGKGKKGRKVGHLVAEIKSPASSKDATKVQQIKGTKKNKIKKQKEEARDCVVHASEQKTVASAVFKKKKQGKIMRKNQPKNAKDGKRKKNLSMEENVNVKLSTTSVDAPGPHIKQVSLLLLKGHKQPQLKVHKLDPSKTSGQTQETSPQESQTVPQHSKDGSEPTNDLTEESKKKVGRPKKNQKALSLLSSLQVSRQPPEALPTKTKTTRKRKASSNVETEGIITAHSKRALECNDCGERFSEVSSLQKHKATVHIVESPGLTYTNGNVFEGVSGLYQLPKHDNKVVAVISATADWDTEPEMGEMALEDRERVLSFPALIPSPSLPVPPSDVEGSAYEGKSGGKIRADDESHTSPEVHLPSDQLKKYEISPNVTSEPAPCTSTQTRSLEAAESLASDESKQEKVSPKHPGIESGVQVATDEDIKEDLLLEVDLVTVGEHNERDDQMSPQENAPQNESKGSGDESTETLVAPEKPEETEKSLTLQTVSCSTHQVEVKEEEEEVLVQRKKEGERDAVTKNGTRATRRGIGCLKRDAISKKVLGGDHVRGTESDKDQSECQVVYEEHPVTSDLEIDGKDDTDMETSQPETHPEFETNKATTPTACLPPVPSTSDESAEEQVIFELQSDTPSVEEVMDKEEQREGQQHGRETNQSPGIILEKVVTSSQRETADKGLHLTKQKQSVDSIAENEAQVPGNDEIKVEENISDPPLAGPTCQDRLSAGVLAQHHDDVRTVLVKEESSHTLNEAQATQSNRHIRWSVEPVNEENTPTPLMESGETMSDCHISPDFNTNQCIFYPVKEEEREVLLGDAQSSRGSLTPEGSSAINQTELQTADDEGSHSSQDYQETGVRGLLSDPAISDFADGNAEEDAEGPHPPDLRDFLLQSSDEEDMGVPELSDPQLDSEAEVMAYFYKNQTNGAQHQDQTSQNLPSSSKWSQAPRDEHRNREPIDYFSKYFGWDTWEEIAVCTKKQSNLTNPVSKREVAQFVGIHIAMGTLKFPSPRLYWEDLTKVPLIAEAMPLSRFLELSCKLKLASPAEDPATVSVQKGQHDSDSENGQKGKTQSSTQNAVSQHDDWQLQSKRTKDLSSSKTQTDPLWKVQPILCRFKAGCQSLTTDGEYAVDQYPLPLTGKMHNNKLSLQCTTLIGFGGLVFHVDLKLDLSDKEDAVEKMAPRGSMVFLCRQELSTPAMLERLLVAGVHGAGRVGGARGQIGDEFVSSDGKLMLRRSHCGFILSTAGNSQRNTASHAENFEKAQMSARLSRDLQNLYPICLTASAPTCWPQAVLWYLTDLALINSWLLYRQDHWAESAPFTLMAFRLEVSKALILCSGSDTQDSVPPQPPTERVQTANEIPNPSLVEESPLPNAATRYDGSGHWPEQLAEGEGGRCRYGDCQRTSRVLCLKCCVFLCISRNHNCFLNFHNQGSLGKV